MNVEIDGKSCTKGHTRLLSDSGRKVKSAFAKKFDIIENRYSKGELVELRPVKLEPDNYVFFNTDCVKLSFAGRQKKFRVNAGSAISLGVLQISLDPTKRSASITSRPFKPNETAVLMQKFPALAGRLKYVPWDNIQASK